MLDDSSSALSKLNFIAKSLFKAVESHYVTGNNGVSFCVVGNGSTLY